RINFQLLSLSRESPRPAAISERNGAARDDQLLRLDLSQLARRSIKNIWLQPPHGARGAFGASADVGAQLCVPFALGRGLRFRGNRSRRAPARGGRARAHADLYVL